MRLKGTVITVAECLRTDCRILGDNKKLLQCKMSFSVVRSLRLKFAILWDVRLCSMVDSGTNNSEEPASRLYVMALYF
jgi:hypothetical protein